MRIERCNSLNFIFRGNLPQSLKKLRIEDCEKLLCLLDDANTYTSHLEDLYINGCPALTCLQAADQISFTLTRLEIWDCSKFTTLSSTGQLPVALKHLEIHHCSELKTLLLQGLLPETLETLKITFCPKLVSIVEKFHNNKALHEIYTMGCSNLKSFPEGLHTLSSLHFLYIAFCNDFASFPKGGFPNSNFRLLIHGCEKLEALPSEIQALSSLVIIDCPNMSLSEEGLPTKLSLLYITSLKQYKALMQTGLQNFTSLTSLRIIGKPDDESLQEEDMTVTLPRTLTLLSIGYFPKLKYLPFKNLEDLPCLDCLGYDIESLFQEARSRWLKPTEVHFILQNHEKYKLNQEAPQKPSGGSVFLFNKRVLRFFHKDGHNWCKKKDSRAVGEAHERLKVGNAEALNCYYAHGEQNPNFQRRSYWMSDPAYDHIVLVHYQEITEGKPTSSSIAVSLEAGASSTVSLSPNSYTTQNPGSTSVHGDFYEPCHQSSSCPGSVEVSSEIAIKDNVVGYYWSLLDVMMLKLVKLCEDLRSS
ncbi:hypothetical protein EZV62_008417 [Acer yangbiense]|uniref:CG-1 domain-containing protein n=1 Tax=Acer yangbiense TaxID=1000413 RepID=A0A5C7IE09_9ROSI|nr:hypothetical protein EZV62_008417 [Acer yangbiense]